MPSQEALLVRVARALAEKTRWRIVHRLLNSETAIMVKELVLDLEVTQPNISKHLRILREAGIVQTQKDQNAVLYSVVPEICQTTPDGSMMLAVGPLSVRFEAA